jgi:tetratricopeptide (TPR) repeat protein
MLNKEKSKVEKVSLKDQINDFIQRNRKVIFTITVIVVILFFGTVLFLVVKDNIDKAAIAEIEVLNRRYQELRFNVNEEFFADEISSLLADLEVIGRKRSGYAGGKAWITIAAVHAARHEWEQAEEAYLNAARKGARTYLGPVALFNAAAAAEEQGKYELAIELLEQCLAHRFEFPAAPRAQFSIGRLNEQIGNFTAAAESYRAVLVNWPNLPVWQQMARSRITAIEIR